MTAWYETTTGNLLKRGVIEIGDGYRAKNSEFVTHGGLPFVRVADVSRTIRLDGRDELPIEQMSKYRPKVSRPFDSLITMKGTVGRVAYVKAGSRPFVYSPQISYWRSHDPDQVNPRWLRYWLESPEFLAQASATKGATDMADYINLRDQRRMRITLPPQEVQVHLAEVVGSFDDLIENNRRRIEILEEMARLVYREWFVYFRFPGHEDVGLVESDLGPLPEGWEAVNLFHLADVAFGFSFKSNRFTDAGPFPVVRIRDIPKNSTSTFTDEEPGDRYSIVDGDILIGMDGDFHMCRWANGLAYLNQRVTRIRTDGPLSQYHLFLGLERPIRHFNDSIIGTTVAHLGKRHLEEIVIAVPTEPVLQAAEAVFRPIFELEVNLRKQGRALAEARDLLLPRLLSGELDVSDLDLDLEPVA